jgi:hypothetical protein
MANIHGAPGAYLSGEARRYVDRALLAAVLLVVGSAVAMGYSAAAFTWYVAVPLLLVLCATLWVTRHLLDRHIAALQRERLKFLKGARAEELVGWLLEDLPSSWHVFHGIQIRERRDLDHVAVGPGGLYLISTKSMGGLFSLGPTGEVLHNNQPTKLPQYTAGQAIELRRRLAALMNADGPYVNAVLAVPFARVEFSGPRHNVWVLHQDDLLRTLETAPPRLTDRQVQAYVKALEMLAGSALDVARAASRAGLAPASNPTGSGGSSPND